MQSRYFGVIFLFMIKLMLVGLVEPLRIRMNHVILPKGRCGPFFFSAAQFFNSLSRAVTRHKLCSCCLAASLNQIKCIS